MEMHLLHLVFQMIFMVQEEGRHLHTHSTGKFLQISLQLRQKVIQAQTTKWLLVNSGSLTDLALTRGNKLFSLYSFTCYQYQYQISEYLPIPDSETLTSSQ